MLISVKQVTKQIKKRTLVHPVSFESQSGDICLDKKSIIKNPEKMRAGLGYLPQKFPIYDHLSVDEFLLFMASIKEVDPPLAKQQIQEYLVQFHLMQSRDSKLMDLSGGMLQKVGIINSLLGNPDII